MANVEKMAPETGKEFEKPLPAAKHGLYLAASTALIVLYYLYCAVVLILGTVVWVLLAILSVFGVQYGFLLSSYDVVTGWGSVLVETARSLRLAESIDYQVDLTREEAPDLWAEVESLAGKMGVAPPHEIKLEGGLTAWVRLKGFAQGRGHTRLGIGFDMLTGLTAGQARAVLAHEIAHAKYVRRGYQGFLMRGYYRLLQYTRSLQTRGNNKENPAAARKVVGWATKIPKKISDRVGRWIAACSRYDEFLADRKSADICGSGTSCEALLATHVLEYQSSRIDWRDRVLHADRAPGYTTWLLGKLEVTDESRRQELEDRAVSYARRHELDTHPALPDRLEALKEIDAPGHANKGDEHPAVISWLKEPDATARRLLRELEKIAAGAEHKETERLNRKMKRMELYRNAALHYAFGVVFCWGWAVIFAWAWWFNRTSDGPQADNNVLGFISLVCVVIGIGTLLQAFSPKVKLPFPTFADYRAAGYVRWERDLVERAEYEILSGAPAAEKPLVEAVQDERTAKERSALAASLREAAPALKKRAALRYWLGEAVRYLQAAKYEEALNCAHFALEQKQHHPEAVMIVSICRANRGDRQAVTTLHESLMNRSHFDGQWAMGWCGTLAKEFGVSEAYLLQVTGRRADVPIFWALLGFCQAHTGKPREALASRKKALELATSKGNLADEACHHQALAQNFIMLGMLDEAGREFRWLQRHVEAHGITAGLHEKRIRLDRLKWFLASERMDEALELVTEILQQGATPGERLNLTTVLMETMDPMIRERTQEIYEALLSEGHYPQVHQSLSQIAFDREDRETGRVWLMGALDLVKKRPTDAVHPLNILDDVLTGMRVLADRQPAAVKAWECHLEAPDTPMTVKKLSLLCLHPTEEEALGEATAVFQALLPETDLAGLTSVTQGEENLQPDEEMPPGIYGSRW